MNKAELADHINSLQAVAGIAGFALNHMGGMIQTIRGSIQLTFPEEIGIDEFILVLQKYVSDPDTFMKAREKKRPKRQGRAV